MRIKETLCLRCGTKSELITRSERGFVGELGSGSGLYMPKVNGRRNRARKIRFADRTVERHRRILLGFGEDRYNDEGKIWDSGMCVHCGVLHYNYQTDSQVTL